MTTSTKTKASDDKIDVRNISAAEWNAALRDLQTQDVRRYVHQRDQAELAKLAMRFPAKGA